MGWGFAYNKRGPERVIDGRSNDKWSDAPRPQGGASRKQTNTGATGGFVLPGRVKQRKHESADVSFCDPVQNTG